jgi:hypothetical protein
VWCRKEKLHFRRLFSENESSDYRKASHSQETKVLFAAASPGRNYKIETKIQTWAKFELL